MIELIIFLQVVGWLYACGVHYDCKETVRKHGKPEDIESLDFGGWPVQYGILFFTWPHYLGSGK